MEETYAAGFVAGYRWTPLAQDWTNLIPATVVTVSDCLADFLPPDQDPLTAPWHTSLGDAISAARQAPVSARTVHILAMSVPEPGASELMAMIDQWIGGYPHPIRINLTRQIPTPTGRVQGFEVLGFEAGRFHSWLCYGLHEQAADKLGVHANDVGLLDTFDAARQVADMANGNHGTPDGTPEEVEWFPALITEYDPGQHGPGSIESGQQSQTEPS